MLKRRDWEPAQCEQTRLDYKMLQLVYMGYLGYSMTVNDHRSWGKKLKLLKIVNWSGNSWVRIWLFSVSQRCYFEAKTDIPSWFILCVTTSSSQFNARFLPYNDLAIQARRQGVGAMRSVHAVLSQFVITSQFVINVAICNKTCRNLQIATGTTNCDDRYYKLWGYYRNCDGTHTHFGACMAYHSNINYLVPVLEVRIPRKNHGYGPTVR